MDETLVIASSLTEIASLVAKLNASFAFKDLWEVNYFLGIQIKHTFDGMHFSQNKDITDLLCKANMQYANGLKTPMTGGEKLYVFGNDLVNDPQSNFIKVLLDLSNMPTSLDLRFPMQ